MYYFCIMYCATLREGSDGRGTESRRPRRPVPSSGAAKRSAGAEQRSGPPVPTSEAVRRCRPAKRSAPVKRSVPLCLKKTHFSFSLCLENPQKFSGALRALRMALRALRLSQALLANSMPRSATRLGSRTWQAIIYYPMSKIFLRRLTAAIFL